MSPRRLTAVVLLAAGLIGVLCGPGLCQEGPAPRAKAVDKPPEAEPAPPEFPPGPEARPPRSLRGRRPPSGPPAGPLGPRGPGANRPGGRMEQRGPRRPGHPSGPPRWPFHNWDALENTDPEMYKLLQQDYDMERRTRELAIQHRRTSRERRAGIRDQLKKLVDEHFQVRQQRRTLELKRLEEELQRLRDAIKQRDEARKTLVGERVSDLLDEDDGLDF